MDPGRFQLRFELSLDRFHTGQLCQHDMRRKGIFGSADRPDMDVVHGLDTRHGLHRLFHLVDADTHGNAVERQTRVSDQTDATITAATTSPTTGSTIVHPVHEITTPDTSTPTDTSASAAICK